jgi:hypothetical protein
MHLSWQVPEPLNDCLPGEDAGLTPYRKCSFNIGIHIAKFIQSRISSTNCSTYELPPQGIGILPHTLRPQPRHHGHRRPVRGAEHDIPRHVVRQGPGLGVHPVEHVGGNDDAVFFRQFQTTWSLGGAVTCPTAAPAFTWNNSSSFAPRPAWRASRSNSHFTDIHVPA